VPLELQTNKHKCKPTCLTAKQNLHFKCLRYMNSSFLVTKVHKLDFFNKLHKLSYRVFHSIVLGSKMYPNSFALQQDIKF
jgi:hypothetical protein